MLIITSNLNLCTVCRAAIWSSNVTRSFSTTQVLGRVKRKQRKFRPLVPPFTRYGDSHRLMRGLCVKGERYGPLVDLPDYTYLDGRPTPLTPQQREIKAERRQLSEKVVRFMKEMDNVREYNINREDTSTKKTNENS
ncbi:39S ribosomal protein L52, mitochondrial-like [Mya arenaria]|uniref:39S ribosomal protein L52, mitochondrial-like n=1 Tax=Mya arenaria TaxID=6604 RepID=UPI0022E50EFB|nr:39S ribosomal protein L52, mitochondrial-like [Mya arenaria]